MKLKFALLLILLGAALFTGAEALQSLRRDPRNQVPEEIYDRYARRAGSAVYVLRREGDYIAVCPNGRSREPISITGIELRSLRRADQAMIEAGLPVQSLQELLQLREDLGS